jgi:murein DD-endopeptidase MepM/ murein hydrolase activator NlpD
MMKNKKDCLTIQRIVFSLLLLGVALMPLTAQEDDAVRVYTEQQDDYRILFYADNDLFIPAYVYIDFTRLENYQPDVEVPFGMELAPESEGQYLFALEPGDGTRLSYSFTYTYSRGNPFAVDPDEDFLYLFPFAHGTKHRLTQGFNGRFTHFDDNQYALDFDLDIGTEVYAARSGVVVEVKEDSNTGGPGAQYGRYANYILIMHDDGTFGNYVHLRQNGAEVEPGQEVEAGEFIGYSGNTGRSSGPHLHFDVRVPLPDGGMMSIPIRFMGLDGQPVDPEEDEIYYAFHPGKPEFDVVFGADFTNEDFAGHSQRTQARDRLDFRVEQTDLTYVMFMGNGFGYPIEAEVTLRLDSMDSTSASPITVRLDALEERFLTILRPRPGASSWRYGYSVSYRRLE